MNAGDYYYSQVLSELAWPLIQNTFKNAGLWELNSGDLQYGYLGSRFTDTFGSDVRLVFSPLSWAGGSRSPIADGVMGIGDDVSYCYGSRINASYGGPNVTINRGPRLNKNGVAVSLKSLALRLPQASLLRSLYDGLAEHELGANEPVKREDKSITVAVGLLNVCVTLTTALLDLFAKITYKQAAKDSVTKWSFQNDNDLSAKLNDLQMTHRYLPRRLLAIIYHLEVACTWKQLGTNLINGLAISVAAAAAMLAVVGTMGALLLSVVGGFIAAGVTKTKRVITLVMIVLAIVGALIAVLVGMLA